MPTERQARDCYVHAVKLWADRHQLKLSLHCDKLHLRLRYSRQKTDPCDSSKPSLRKCQTFSRCQIKQRQRKTEASTAPLRRREGSAYFADDGAFADIFDQYFLINRRPISFPPARLGKENSFQSFAFLKCMVFDGRHTLGNRDRL